MAKGSNIPGFTANASVVPSAKAKSGSESNLCMILGCAGCIGIVWDCVWKCNGDPFCTQACVQNISVGCGICTACVMFCLGTWNPIACVRGYGGDKP
jgi:hypothetical protein